LRSPTNPRQPHHGALRLLLAVTVAVSHLGVRPCGFQIGVMSVMIFYLLAGMVADKLISTPGLSSPLAYWSNRLHRIVPLYYFSLIIASIAWFFGAKSFFLARSPSAADLFANIFIIPLSYFMYTGQDAFTLIPPAWSLGVELQFYLLVPLLLPRRGLMLLVLWTSFFVFCLAVLGVLNTDYFGYRLLPGVLFVFLAGALLHRGILGCAGSRQILVGLWFGLVLLTVWVLCRGQHLPFNYEALAALLVGLPLLYFSTSPFPLWADRIFGVLSYGVFLLHLPALWLLEIGLGRVPSIPAVLTLTLFLAALGHLLAEGKWPCFKQ